MQRSNPLEVQLTKYKMIIYTDYITQYKIAACNLYNYMMTFS
jgi:hypothetical protein